MQGHRPRTAQEIFFLREIARSEIMSSVPRKQIIVCLFRKIFCLCHRTGIVQSSYTTYYNYNHNHNYNSYSTKICLGSVETKIYWVDYFGGQCDFYSFDPD